MPKNNLIALVTGGSRGIGKAISLALSRKGITVCINYSSNEDEANKTIKEIELEGGIAIGLKGSVSDVNDVKKVVKEIITRYGKIDICVNNAGITRDKLFLMMQEADWKDVISVNLIGTIIVTKEVSKYMIPAGRGRIVNISSIGGIVGTPGQANYAASKAGVIGLTKSLAKEFAPYNITVNSIAAGYVDTDMISKMGQNRLDKIIETIPLKRFAKPEEIAANVLHLVGEDSGYITGQTLNIDGGITSI